jgi:hypothetical protein
MPDDDAGCYPRNVRLPSVRDALAAELERQGITTRRIDLDALAEVARMAAARGAIAAMWSGAGHHLPQQRPGFEDQHVCRDDRDQP